MDISKQIDSRLEELKIKAQKVYKNPTQHFGIMGVNFGADLKERLRVYAFKNNLKMSQIIRASVEAYLDTKEENVHR